MTQYRKEYCAWYWELAQHCFAEKQFRAEWETLNRQQRDEDPGDLEEPEEKGSELNDEDEAVDMLVIGDHEVGQIIEVGDDDISDSEQVDLIQVVS